MRAEDELRATMRSAGLVYEGPIYADGELHRFLAEGDHSPNSWYVLHGGSPAAGAFGCWKRQVKVTWHGPRDRGPSERGLVEVRLAGLEAQRARQRMELRRQYVASRAADWFLAQSMPADPMHPYLRRKGVKPFGNLRQWKEYLVVPLCNVRTQLQTVQFIAPDKRFGGTDGGRDKNFLGGGKAAGAFFTLSDEPGGRLVICEGYATGASIHQATGCAVICAMNCGNLTTVAKALRRAFPNREILIAADNDQWSDGNPGLTMAKEAARSVQARLALPRFRNCASKPTDFNDLHMLEGLPEVKWQIEDVVSPSAVQEEDLGEESLNGISAHIELDRRVVEPKAAAYVDEW